MESGERGSDAYGAAQQAANATLHINVEYYKGLMDKLRKGEKSGLGDCSSGEGSLKVVGLENERKREEKKIWVSCSTVRKMTVWAFNMWVCCCLRFAGGWVSSYVEGSSF